MIYRPLGKTGITTSAVGLGTWNLGNQWGELSEAEALAETAIPFTLSHPSCPVTIPGAKSPAQAAANAKAGSEPLGAEEYARLPAL